jgi:hypothetical protein
LGRSAIKWSTNKNLHVRVAADSAARDEIAQVCSPYRTKLDRQTWHEEALVLQTGRGAFHDARTVQGIFPGSDTPMSGADPVVRACPPDWGGLLGAVTASVAGVTEPPDPSAAEPDLDDGVRSQLMTWLLGVPGATAPEALVRPATEGQMVHLNTQPTARIRSMAGLVQVSHAARRRTGLVVLGDEPEDYALARLWHLMYGFGQWLPSLMGIDQDPPEWSLSHGIAEMAYRHRQQAGTLAVTSVSRSVDAVTQMNDRLRKGTGWMTDEDREAVAVMPVTQLPWTQSSTTHFAVAEQFDSYVSVPIVVDETGTRNMAAPLPAPVVTYPYLRPTAELTWHVDIGWPRNEMVRGRGLDGQEVFTPETEDLLTWVAAAATESATSPTASTSSSAVSPQ